MPSNMLEESNLED